MRLHDPNLRPKRLPPHAGLFDRLEYGLQWLVYICYIRIGKQTGLERLLEWARNGNSCLDFGAALLVVPPMNL
jgi:hypothetical protein